MFLFMIKKWFFDFWDNFFTVAIMNIGFIAVVAASYYGAMVFSETHPIITIIVSAIGILLVTMYSGIVHELTAKLADYQKAGFREIPDAFRQSWKLSLVVGIINIIIYAIVLFIIPFYMDGSIVGLLAIGFLFWSIVMWILASQYAFPVSCRLDRSLRKIFKKTFILFFDNGGFSILTLLLSVVIFAISVFTAFLMFGPASILLLQQVAMKLRLYKYDYLEENPQANRKKIPWRALLIDDQERVGKRTFRGMIFPWKE